MMNTPLNKILHQPIRTNIMAYLHMHDSCDYVVLRDLFKLSDGHMTTHMKALIKHGYISMKKEFIDNKPRTTYSITPKGKLAFKEYISHLRTLIEL